MQRPLNFPCIGRPPPLSLQAGPLVRVSALASILGDHVICEPLTPFLCFANNTPLCARGEEGRGGGEFGTLLSPYYTPTKTPPLNQIQIWGGEWESSFSPTRPSEPGLPAAF